MDRSNTMTLLTASHSVDSIGQYIETVTSSNVFCQVQSVTRQEWFEGGRSGLVPEYKVTMFAPEYNGQTEVIINGIKYSVYRTYLTRNDNIELYLERKPGV